MTRSRTRHKQSSTEWLPDWLFNSRGGVRKVGETFPKKKRPKRKGKSVKLGRSRKRKEGSRLGFFYM